MRTFIILGFFCLLTVSCKTETKEQDSKNETISEENKKLSIAEKIAKAHGIEQWESVSEIAFTFNVDADGNHFERSWSWNPQTNDVRMMTSKDTINFNRSSIDSLSLNADKAFVNDKYWLLAPFQLVWDDGTTISEPVKEIAPISKKELQKITLTYTGDGGYTPGDAYDFYYNKDYLIEEWIFRKGNTDEPSMITTFENYEDFNGINIAKDHIKLEGDWKLYFTNIKLTSK